MNKHERIKNVFKKVMYLSENTDIDNGKSLFLFYDMSSVDFIDFVFEIRKEFNITSQGEHLWPVKSLMDNPEYFSPENKWTNSGLTKLNECLLLENESIIKNESISGKELMDYFTINYVARRIDQELK